MAAYQTKFFKKWNKNNRISTSKLLNAIKSIDDGSGVVDLGGDLYKVRIAKDKGKRGGYRTIIIHKKGVRSMFIYGFEKSEKDNISEKELSIFKKRAGDFLGYSEAEIKKMLDLGEIFNLENEQ